MKSDLAGSKRGCWRKLYLATYAAAVLLTNCHSLRDEAITPLPDLADLADLAHPEPIPVAIPSLPTSLPPLEIARGPGTPLAYLHHAVQSGAGFEIGPLATIETGPLRGDGMVFEKTGIDALFEMIEALPVVDQARLMFNRFAATLLRMDVDGDGTLEPVFVTIEFPLGGEIVRNRTNPLTGELERLVFEDGRWVRTITARQVTELSMDEDSVESSSKVFANEGTIDDPVPGALLEETRTVEVWYRDWSKSDIGADLPAISKVRVNYVTGSTVKETYGLHARPIEVVDGRFVSEYDLGSSGLIQSAEVFENGREDDEFTRPLMTRLLEPVRGELRYRYTDPHGTDLAGLRANEYRLTLNREDLFNGLSKTIVLDLSRGGRTHAERFDEELPGAGKVSFETRYHYRDDFQFGQIPRRSVKRAGGDGGMALSETTTEDYDPLTRRLTARVFDYTGKITTQVWDARWESPVTITSAARRTTLAFDRRGLSFTGETSSQGDPDHEVISVSQGQFDPARGVWSVKRKVFYRPGIPLREETITRSANGHRLATRSADGLEARLEYSTDGREVATRTYLEDAAGRSLPLREESDYRWEGGTRRASVRTFVEDNPHDHFETVVDSEGRELEDQIKNFPGLELRTVRQFDGGSDRVLRAIAYQNGEIRATSEPGEATEGGDGIYHLPVRSTPDWGLQRTDYYTLDGRNRGPVRSVFENGEESTIMETFPGTALTRRTQSRKPGGRGAEESVLQLSTKPVDGMPVDLVYRYELGPSGERRLIEEQALVRGTDILVYTERNGKRLHFDLGVPAASPRFEVDRTLATGLAMTIDGAQRSNVTRLFHSRRGTWQTEPALLIESIDLRGFFAFRHHLRFYDRSGTLLEEQVRRLRGSARAAVAGISPFQAATSQQPERTVRYHYKTDELEGWRREVTKIEVSESPEDVANPARQAPELSLSQSLTEPRKLPDNPYLPDHDAPWVQWRREANPAHPGSSRSEVIFDGREQPAVTVTPKKNARGEAAIRIAYDLPLPTSWIRNELKAGSNRIELDLKTIRDYSNCHFLAISIRERDLLARLRLELRDGTGRLLLVAPTAAEGQVAFWPGDGETIQWLPKPTNARAAASVRAIASGTLLVSVPELHTAGLDTRNVTAATLVAEAQAGATLERTPLQRLAAPGALPRPSNKLSTGVSTIAHSSGLHAVSSAPSTKVPSGKDAIQSDPYWNSEIRFHNATIAKVRPRWEASNYPVVVVQDPSSPFPAPLYALVAESGEFLEYYHRSRGTDERVYTVAGGFRPPRMESFRRGVLEDEASPGILAVGNDYEIELPLSRTSRLHNRVASSIFKLGADRMEHLLFPLGDDLALSHPDSKVLHQAELQAKNIAKLPTFAEALLPFQEVPWKENPSPHHETRSDDLLEVPEDAASWFTTAQDSSEAPPLISTSPGTEIEAFVDTVQEARLIQAAIQTGQFEAAANRIDYYWNKSRAGTEALHTSYDLRTGASLHLQPKFSRPSESPQTASAQLAIAEAALTFAEATGDKNAWVLGKNLLQLLLDDFRAPERSEQGPRGISEQIHRPRPQRLGFTLWPEPAQFSLETNARIFLALKRSVSVAKEVAPSILSWQDRAGEASAEMEDWLRTVILPHVEGPGIVPNGVFEIQDLHNETSALAVSRWTSARAWMSFLEAADAIGISRAQTQHWLENLTRVHGAKVGEIWGLDWSVALTRPEAISPDLTAQFFHTARLLGHRSAAMYARHQLVALGAETGEPMPVVLTTLAPERRLPTGQNSSVYPLLDQRGWPVSGAPYRHLTSPAGVATGHRIVALRPAPQQDVRTFLGAISWFYLSIFIVALVWWMIRCLRRRLVPPTEDTGRLVSDAVMAAAEKRWAERVLGVRVPDDAPNSRHANGPVEGNFIMQLRAIYKLVLEWRRLESGRAGDDADLAVREDDPWLNGADEFAAMVAIYMRYTIKAGLKDGFHDDDVLEEAEDSNHIWSRLVLYFSEYYSGLLTLLQLYHEAKTPKDRREINQKIFLLLNSAGMRQRKEPFDGRRLFEYPGEPGAFDLLIVQKPGVTLQEVVSSAAERLSIPERQFKGFVNRYKEFKRRESSYPVHPLVLEAAKVLPHLLLVGLLGILWYNSEVAGLPVLPYLSQAMGGLVSARSLLWALPLGAGYGLGIIAYYMKFLRYESGMRAPRPMRNLFLPVRNLIRKPDHILPLIKPGRRWDPTWYNRSGYLLRGIGFFVIGVELLSLPTPSFAVFMILKGVLALLLILEAAAIFLPFISTWLSMWLQERVTRGRRPWRLTRLLNQLNIPATRPASIVWQALAYHFQISVPSGSLSALLRAIILYFAFAAAFLFAGGYVFKEVLAVWFADTYQTGQDGRLLIGGFVFFNTMYLLRFGLFVLVSSTAAALATYPLKIATGISVIGIGLGMLADVEFSAQVASNPTLVWSLAIFALALVTFEGSIMGAFTSLARDWRKKRCRGREEKLEAYRRDETRTLGIVYMSGDELGFGKLTPELMMDRVHVLRERLDSSGARLMTHLLGNPDDETLRASFEVLYETETEADTTLWHPAQLVVRGEEPPLPPELGLNLTVPHAEERDRLLGAWNARRWLVSMMSSAGHSQDTAINLVDIALRVAREGLSERTVFFLIQNKYDARDDNRPGQMRYGAGELGQREKLTRLLRWASPGSRAFSLNDWTPFGFKAGGMMGMDLIHEEALKLTNMVILDRNATVHDLDALTEDITTALTDPGVVNVIPGRGTTNTRTPVGQGSQAMEEGHRQLMKGVMLMGGEAGESVGTGWGNIQAIYYGRTQRAMMDSNTRLLPLTTRMMRGSSFADRLEGMVGFGPHAVGISEDIWAVIQGAHNAVSLGMRPKFKRSKAMWHKIRETWSHADWFSAFPRWSGGFLQMMQDPLMQRIGDNGPLSVFAKELRANNGRFFLCAPFALLSILLMPLAIIMDASPFVQILIVLWNAGFILNQVLTSLGLVATLEATGFSRLGGLLGAAAAGSLALAGGGFSLAVCALAMILGSLTGGFLAGLGRWLYNRGRDIILFGPQLVIFALGQFVRQSLEFVLSGAAADDAKGVNIAFRSWAGPREDRPLTAYPNPINLRSVVWAVGGLSMLLNLFALTNLDFLNVVLLLPSLLFSVSCLAGPFLMSPKRGRKLGMSVFLPKVLGWTCGFALLIAVAGMVARGGRMEQIALGLILLCLACFASHALRYVLFPWKLRKARRTLARLLRRQNGDQLDAADCAGLTASLLPVAHEPSVVQEILAKAGLSPNSVRKVRAHVEKRIAPILAHPSAYVNRHPTIAARLSCEFRRSFVLSIATLIWFLIVPVPGLLIFTAGSYRIALSHSPFIGAVAGSVGVVLAVALAGLLVERLFHLGPGRRGLLARVQATYRRFRSQTLTDIQTSSIFALFTDLHTYIDQRAYAYARRTLDQIEYKLQPEEAPTIDVD